MADPLMPTSSSESTYRPISGLAVVGFGISALFAVLVVFSTLGGFFQGAPVFLSGWSFLFAILGIVLSFLGYRQIKNSEGTREGTKIALAGIWLASITGMGYGVYVYTTGLALTSQANDFLLDDSIADSGFFPRIEKGTPAQLRAAFLLTLPETARRGLRPDDEVSFSVSQDQAKSDGEPGPFSSFKNHFLVRACGPGVQGEIKIEPRGIQDWTYENRHYKVTRNYRFSSPEVVIDMSVPVESVEPEDTGKSRSWFVNLPQLGYYKMTPTDLGKLIGILRIDSRKFVEGWVQELNKGKKCEFNFENSDWNQLIKSTEQRDAARSAIVSLWQGTEFNRLLLELLQSRDNLGDWQFSSTKQLQINHGFRFTLHEPAGLFEGKIIAQTKRNLDPSGNAAGQNLEWEIADVVFTRIVLGNLTPGKRRPR